MQAPLSHQNGAGKVLPLRALEPQPALVLSRWQVHRVVLSYWHALDRYAHNANELLLRRGTGGLLFRLFGGFLLSQLPLSQPCCCDLRAGPRVRTPQGLA